MQSSELKETRKRLGLSRLQLARWIGYTGTDRNDEMRIRQYESTKQVPLHIARFVYLIEQWHIKFGVMPGFPHWPGYVFSHEPDQEKADVLDR